MTQSKNLSVRKHGAGDAVVDGLLRGIVAGLAMAAVLVIIELLQGQSAGITLGRFGLNGPATPVAGSAGPPGGGGRLRRHVGLRVADRPTLAASAGLAGWPHLQPGAVRSGPGAAAGSRFTAA